MTEEQIANWEIERDIARKSGDPELMQKALDHKDRMLMTCIAHQSDRVKTIKADLATVKDEVSHVKSEMADVKKDLKPCVETDKEFRIHKERIKGAKIMLQILKWVLAAGGGAFAMRLIQNCPT